MCVELLAQALPAQHETAVWLLITSLHRKAKMAVAKHLHAVNCAKRTLLLSLGLWKLLRKEYHISKEDMGWEEERDKRRRQSPVGTQTTSLFPEWLTAVSLLTLALEACWTTLKLDQVVCRNVLKAPGPPATVITAQPVFFFLITTPNEQIPLKQVAAIQARIPAFKRWRQEEKSSRSTSVI